MNKEQKSRYNRYIPLVTAFGIGSLAVGGIIFDQRRKLQGARTQNRELQHQLTYDYQTGLRTKRYFSEELASRMQEGKLFGVLFTDLDRAKVINDTYGHDVLDGILRGLGSRLKESFRREGDVVAHEKLISDASRKELGETTSRYGGDEFASIVSLADNGNREQNPENQMENNVKYLRNIFYKYGIEISEEHEGLILSASIGYAIYDPQNPVDSATLLRTADQNMYLDKKQRKGGV